MRIVPIARVIFASVALACAVGAAPADAATSLTWDRSAEGDMDHYNVYLCTYVPPATSCTVQQNNAMKQSVSVMQPATGTLPVWTLPAGVNGSAAVSAVDKSFNESGISVPVPFDTMAPAIPANPRLQ